MTKIRSLEERRDKFGLKNQLAKPKFEVGRDLDWIYLIS
uniref:Uncharacterized protein n=1 Tax=Medicago truncatula TaxID=3880 RepID=Q2HU32_MEDTR|nr:hypothetical protein MtrDRAFT_AC149490g4v2 [Medicago truncatula]